MIYGIVPVGGKGLRLSLPFPKELLPQKGFNYYNPIINHVVGKMLQAGAERIFFIHGTEFKQYIVDYYSEAKMVHIQQQTPGFAVVLKDFYDSCIKLELDDKVLFGLPDSIFEGNPFPKMLESEGVVCGLFNSDHYTKVDRLTKADEQMFEVKAQKSDTNQNWGWGVLKFEGRNIITLVNRGLTNKFTEIGDILNHFPKTYVFAESYLDLGTWENYNRYLSLYEDRRC